jgi:hypothetical protein
MSETMREQTYIPKDMETKQMRGRSKPNTSNGMFANNFKN